MFSADLGVTPTAANYIEDVFSTYLYTGTGSTLSISNGIDLSTKGGLVFIKDRTNGGTAWSWVDTARGIYQTLESQNTGNQTSRTTGITAFNTTGFTMGSYFDMNTSATNYASWTLRKQPKFFDIVTWTGNGVADRAISHNLGSTPGCIFVKRYDGGFGEDWWVWHRSLTSSQNLVLNTTAAATTQTPNAFGTVNSTSFTLPNGGVGNSSGYSYVAYLFAHDAGGFGAAGTDNVISCGSFTTDGSGNATVTLGYEPQWIITKRTDSTSNWTMQDIMRGLGVLNSTSTELRANTSSQEFDSTGTAGNIFATGFNQTGLSASATYIYIAIRRGPMKTPTSGTSVFSPITTNTTVGTKQTTNFPIDLQINRYRRTTTTGSAAGTFAIDRLRGVSTNSTAVAQGLQTNNTTAENDYPADLSLFWDSTGFQVTAFADLESSVWWSFRRAPGFFDVVCYTGTGANRTVNHNLGVAPEMMIVKRRDAVGNWRVYQAGLTSASYFLQLQATGAQASSNAVWNGTAPTSSVFSVGTDDTVNANAGTFVNYLFATVAGVSKVGSYTGTGALQTVNCGFTSGARFVLIKRTDSTGDWYVWDSARGISSGNDPYLLLNSTAAEVTGTNYVDTTSTGFQVTAAAPAGLNANGGTYIFLAIA